MMRSVPLGLIFYKMKDHKWWKYLYRSELLQVLCKDRVHELSVRSKVYLLNGIQSLTVTANESCEKLVVKIIEETKGEALSELKSLTDAKGDVNNFHKLVYLDVRSDSMQCRILDWIKKQAAFLNSHRQLNSRHAMRSIGQQAWRKIISDVDDTLLCSGGPSHSFGLAGIDTSYPAKQIYPGVIAFYRELDLGTTGADTWDESRVGNLVFLSARPHVYKNTTESVTYDKFRKLPLHTMPTLLAGELNTGAQFALGDNPEPLAVTKFKNLQEYLALYPEYKVIFLGDNGQGDVRTAEMALSTPSYHGNFHRIYVHLVQPQVLTRRGASLAEEEAVARNKQGAERERLLLEDQRRRRLNEEQKMCYFVTYIDAALDAHAHDLIRTIGLRNVMAEAMIDFDKISAQQWGVDEEKVAAVRKDHRGVARGQGSGGRIIEPVGLYLRQKLAASPSAMSSLSGGPALPAPSRVGGASAARRESAPASTTVPLTVSSVWLCFGEPRREMRIRELNLSLQRGNEVLLKAGLQPVPLYDRKFVVGCRLRTEYGVGVVTRVRKAAPRGASQGSYYGATFEVLIQWDATGCGRPVKLFLQDSSVVSLPTITLPLREEVTKFFRTGIAASKKPANQVLLPSAVNLPVVDRDYERRGGSTAIASKPASTLSRDIRFASLTRESVAALPVATPLLPLYEKGEGSTTASSSSRTPSRAGAVSSQGQASTAAASIASTAAGAAVAAPAAAKMPPLPEEDVPPINVVMQTSVFKPSVMDRARTMFAVGNRNRARSSSEHSISSDKSGATGSRGVGPSVAGGVASADKDLSGFMGSQAWTPYGIGEIVGYSDEEGRDIVSLRQYGLCSIDMFVHRSQVVQLTDPVLTRCFPDQVELLLDPDELSAPAPAPLKPETPEEGEGLQAVDATAGGAAIAASTSAKTTAAAPAGNRSSFVSSWFSGIRASGTTAQAPTVATDEIIPFRPETD